MPDRDTRMRVGLLLAGATNLIGVPLFTAAFTDDALGRWAPELFSRVSLLLIMVWGVAYIATIPVWRQARPLFAVFALEKLVYVSTWPVWLAHHGADLPAIWDDSPLAAIFLAIYGPVDLIWGAFFVGALVARRDDPT